MSSRTGRNSGQNPDADGPLESEYELTPGQQMLEIARLTGHNLKREVVFVPIFGLVFLVMGFIWLQGVQAERAVESKSEALRARLNQPAPQPELLSRQAEGWKAAYQVTLESRTARPTDSSLIGRVLDAADEAGLVILETGTTDDDVVQLKDDEYTITPLLLRADGSLSSIQKFLKILETDEFAAFEIQGSNTTAGPVAFSLTLQGIFYSLPENYADQLVSDTEDTQVISIGNTGGGEARP